MCIRDRLQGVLRGGIPRRARRPARTARATTSKPTCARSRGSTSMGLDPALRHVRLHLSGPLRARYGHAGRAGPRLQRRHPGVRAVLDGPGSGSCAEDQPRRSACSARGARRPVIDSFQFFGGRIRSRRLSVSALSGAPPEGVEAGPRGRSSCCTLDWISVATNGTGLRRLWSRRSRVRVASLSLRQHGFATCNGRAGVRR